MSQSEAINELSTALAVAQGAMKAASYNQENPFFDSGYADLAAIIGAVREPLSKNGLSFTQTIEPIQGIGIFLYTTLMHSSGQWVRSTHPLPLNAKPQEFGSHLTYARRYSLSALVGIAAEEDDDANKAQIADDKPIKKSRKKEVKDDILDAVQPETASPPAEEQVPPSPTIDLLTMAREAAQRGEKVFTAFYNRCKEDEQDLIKQYGKELRGLINAAKPETEEND